MSPIDPRQYRPSSCVPLTRRCRTVRARSRAVRAGYVSGTLHVVSPAFTAGAWRYQQETHQMSIEIIPTGAALGAEIRGVDLAGSIGDETFAAIERAYYDHAVIFFRDQHITPPQQVAFTRRFGEIEFNIFGERWNVQAVQRSSSSPT